MTLDKTARNHRTEGECIGMSKSINPPCEERLNNIVFVCPTTGHNLLARDANPRRFSGYLSPGSNLSKSY